MQRKKSGTNDANDPLGLGGGSGERPLRPGDPGWVCRARVPMIDNREYVQRPQWQSLEDMSRTAKKGVSLLEKHKRSFADRRKAKRMQHAVKISLEGKNLKL